MLKRNPSLTDQAKAHIKGGRISASGSVENLVGLGGVSLDVTVKAKTLAGVAGLTGAKLPKPNPDYDSNNS